MTSYGWTIDYINNCVTIPQIIYLLEVIQEKPPSAILGFELGDKEQTKDKEKKLLSQISKLGDKVEVENWMSKSKVKSVTRLRDKVKIK